jgi:hypothetical protein
MVRFGVMTRIMTTLAHQLSIRGRIDVREAFIDASFAPAKKGGKVGKTKRGKGTKVIAVADRNGLPVSVCAESATPHEVKLAMPTLLRMVIPDAPQNLIGDNAYDSTTLTQNSGCTALKSSLHIVGTERIRLRIDVG